MTSPQMQPSPQPHKGHQPGKPPTSAPGGKPVPIGSTARVGTQASVAASLDFSDASNVIIDIGSLDSTATGVSVTWNDTPPYVTSDPADPGLQDISRPYTEGTDDNVLTVVLSYRGSSPSTYTDRNIDAQQSTTRTNVTLPRQP